MSLNVDLQDVILSVQGSATLNANWVAVQVHQIWSRRWAQAFSSDKAKPNAFRGITEEIERIIFSVNDMVFKNTWYVVWVDSIKVMPRQLVTSRIIVPELREAEEDEPDEDEPLPLPALPSPAIKPIPIFRTIPSNPPEALRYADALYRPPTQKEISALNLASEWKEFLGEGTREKEIIKKVTKGLTQGKHNREIARDIMRDTKEGRASSSRIARTEVHRVNTAAQEKSLRSALGPVIKQWKYVATLDDRTRPHHAARDGKVYEDSEPRPLLPDGPNCRCVYAPVAKSFEELGVPELSGLFGPAARAEMTGDAAPDETYNAWFNRQPSTRQRSIVGAERFDKLPKKAGKVTWSDYVKMPNSPARLKPEAVVKGNRSNPKNIKKV